LNSRIGTRDDRHRWLKDVVGQQGRKQQEQVQNGKCE
jgi:hypothetical protein